MLLDGGLAAFGDLEDQVDAVVRPVDDLGLDADVVAPVAAIDLDDALDVGLHERTRERAARLRLDFGDQLLVLDALVALELDAADHRVLDHRDDEAAALPAVAHVGKQAGREQRLDALVGFQGIEPLTGADAEIGADRVRLDAAVALDNDRRSGLRHGAARRHEGRYARPKNNPTEDQAGDSQPSYPHPKSHARCALPLFPVAP